MGFYSYKIWRDMEWDNEFRWAMNRIRIDNEEKEEGKAV